MYLVLTGTNSFDDYSVQQADQRSFEEALKLISSLKSSRLPRIEDSGFWRWQAAFVQEFLVKIIQLLAERNLQVDENVFLSLRCDR